MNLHLPSEMHDYVQKLIVDGKFSSEEAVIEEGLRLLISQDKLSHEIKLGIDQLDNGQWYDEQTVFKELEEDILQIEKNKGIENA
ncbi:MAG: ribbon-helix-helix domain-containing protein [Pirellulales bacterium]